MKNGFLAKVDDNGPLELINDTQNLANLTSQDRLDPADGHLGLIQIETSYAASLINKVFYPHDLQSNERII